MKIKLLTAVIITICILIDGMIPSFADSWYYQNCVGWFYESNGQWVRNQWKWIPVTNDPRIECCYYFDGNGRMYQNQMTPDGWYVDDSGAWKLCGVRQTRPNPSYYYPTYYTPAPAFIPPASHVIIAPSKPIYRSQPQPQPQPQQKEEPKEPRR